MLCLAFGFISVLFLFSCKKESAICNLNNYVGTYILTDSMVYSTGGFGLVQDTVVASAPSSLGGLYTISLFGPSGIFFTCEGCAQNFTVDVNSYSAGTYSGSGSINGTKMKLNIRFVPHTGTDTVMYYCNGTLQ